MNKTSFERVAAARAVLLDLDGCLIERGVLKPGGRAFLRAFGDKTSILSNNSTAPPRRVARFLHRHGVAAADGRIHLAGQAALQIAARRFGQRPVLLLANLAMTRAALRLGLNLSPAPHHDGVVLLRDTRFTYARLEAAVQRLRRGAELIVANPDLTHPAGDGVAPETGALLAAIGACTDDLEARTLLVGKPQPILFEQALARAGVTPGDALMIGDTLETDVEGARRLGIAALHLGPATGGSLQTLMAQGGLFDDPP